MELVKPSRIWAARHAEPASENCSPPLPLLLLLLLLLLLSVRTFCDMVTRSVFRAACSDTRHELLDRTKVPKHHHAMRLSLCSAMLTYSSVRQCFAITALPNGLVPRSATCSSLLTLRTRNLLDLISSCIHKYAPLICFQVSVFSGFRVNGQHWFQLVAQVFHQRHDSL